MLNTRLTSCRVAVSCFNPLPFIDNQATNNPKGTRLSNITSTAFKKGEKRPNQGKRGPSKTPAAIKDMILTALSNAGGAEYLERRANDPRTAAAFLGLVGKVLPTQVTGADGGAIKASLEVIYRSARGD